MCFYSVELAALVFDIEIVYIIAHFIARYIRVARYIRIAASGTLSVHSVENVENILIGMTGRVSVYVRMAAVFALLYDRANTVP